MPSGKTRSKLEEEISIIYLIDQSEAKDAFGAILNDRKYKWLHGMEIRGDYELVRTNRELDSATLRALKRAGYKIYRPL